MGHRIEFVMLISAGADTPGVYGVRGRTLEYGGQ